MRSIPLSPLALVGVARAVRRHNRELGWLGMVTGARQANCTTVTRDSVNSIDDDCAVGRVRTAWQPRADSAGGRYSAPALALAGRCHDSTIISVGARHCGRVMDQCRY